MSTFTFIERESNIIYSVRVFILRRVLSIFSLLTISTEALQT
jgi:hypothetical protein